MLINTDFDEDEDYYEDEHDDFRESHEKDNEGKFFKPKLRLQVLNKNNTNVLILVLILKCTIWISDGDGEEHIDENEMEICDPCHCYGKCCLDVVASIFCVSLL